MVPKNGMGIVFWIDGVPGRRHGECRRAEHDRCRYEVAGMPAARNRPSPSAPDEGDEQADAAIGDDRPAENDGENGASGPSLMVM